MGNMKSYLVGHKKNVKFQNKYMKFLINQIMFDTGFFFLFQSKKLYSHP